MKIHKPLLALCCALAFNTVMANTSPSQQILPGETPQGLSSTDWSSIQALIEARQYESRAGVDGSISSINPAHGWQIQYAADGSTTLRPRADDNYSIALKLTALGYQQLEPLDAPQQISQQDNTVTYQWNPQLQEIWSNSEEALEQWFILTQRPQQSAREDARGNAAQGLLTLEMALTTDMDISQAADGLHFGNTQGIDISYTKLKVWDRNRRTLPAQMVLTGDVLQLRVDDSQALYPLTIDPSFQQQAYLKASNTGAGDRFGLSVAISGDSVVVGAYMEDSSSTGVNSTPDEGALGSGAAYVFTRSGTTWTQQAYLKASNTGAGDRFGRSIAISGDSVVVGAYKEDSSSTGVDSTPNEGADSSGAAYVIAINSVTLPVPATSPAFLALLVLLLGSVGLVWVRYGTAP